MKKPAAKAAGFDLPMFFGQLNRTVIPLFLINNAFFQQVFKRNIGDFFKFFFRGRIAPFDQFLKKECRNFLCVNIYIHIPQKNRPPFFGKAAAACFTPRKVYTPPTESPPFDFIPAGLFDPGKQVPQLNQEKRRPKDIRHSFLRKFFTTIKMYVPAPFNMSEPLLLIPTVIHQKMQL